MPLFARLRRIPWSAWPSSAPVKQLPERWIDGRSASFWNELQEVWHYRDLVWFFIQRDVTVRYRQAVLGLAWTLLQPLGTMLVFTIFFRRFSQPTPDGLPYSLFVLMGLLPWLFVSATITTASQSILSNRHLVTKVYFPRLIIPLSAIGVPLLDLGISLVLLGPVLVFYLPISWMLLFLPTVVLGLGLLAFGIGAWLAGITVAYRDCRYLVPFGLQLWMFSTPAIYLQAAAADSNWLQVVAWLNPLQGWITTFRSLWLGGDVDATVWLSALLISVIVFVWGIRTFHGMQQSLADRL